MKWKLFSLFLLAVSGNINAQNAVQNNGNLQIHSGASVTGFGNFTNTSSGVLVNNGSFYVKGNISNDQSSMSAGTGTLHLNGSSAQAINGAQVFKTYHLVTNNTSGITLNNNLSVSGTHTFSSGLINTSSTPNYMIYEAGSSYSGINDSRHVNGWVKKLGNTDFIFPVGNATFERTVTLTSLTATSEFDVRYNNAVTPNRFSLYNPLVIVDSAEYWTINKISGSAAQVTMNWDNSKVAFPVLSLNDIRASWYDGTFWVSIGGTASGNVLTSGSVTSNSVTAFNTDFVIGSISYVLPLRIISFTAVRINDYTKISWTIGNELNVDHYDLERSDDGINFYTVSSNLPFNRNSTEFYSYDDWKILKGTAYYRLKINNSSASVNYSKIVIVSENNAGKELYVIRNPVDESIDLYAGTSATGTYTYSITTTSGQLMQTGTINIGQSGSHSIRLQSAFAAGSYMLVMKGNTVSLQKLIIKK